MEWHIHKQMGNGQPLVTLDEDGLAAPYLSGKLKHLPWRGIERVAFAHAQGNAILRFQLRSVDDQPARRGFGAVSRQAPRILPLNAMTTEEQERLIDAINQRLTLAGAAGAPPGLPVVNEVQEKRAFQERLIALAPQPWASYALVAVNVVVWLAMLSQGAGVMNIAAETLFTWGGNTASEVQKDEWWRLATAMFLHGGLLHITMNMVGLLSVGPLVERIYGRRLFLLVYLGSGLIGGALSLHFSALNAVSVGASGAIFGLTGALLVAVWQHREKLPQAFGKEILSGVGFFVLYSLSQGFAKEGIDNAAHIGGLLGGALMALILPERFDPAHFARAYMRRAAMALAATVLATVGLVSVAPSAVLDQGRVFASQPHMDHGLAGFDRAIQVLQQEQIEFRAGKWTEQQLDERSRRVHAPAFRKVVEDLSQVVFRPGDPREPLVKVVFEMATLMAESLGMESVIVDGKPQPSDPARAEQINQELKIVSERLQQQMAKLASK